MLETTLPKAKTPFILPHTKPQIHSAVEWPVHPPITQLPMVTTPPDQLPAPASRPLPIVTRMDDTIPLPVVTALDDTTLDDNALAPLLTPCSLPVVTQATSQLDVEEADQIQLPEGNITSGDRVRETTLCYPYQSMPVFPEPTIMIVKKPKTILDLPENTESQSNNSTAISPKPIWTQPVYIMNMTTEMTTSTTTTKSAEVREQVSSTSTVMPTSAAIVPLPMVTLPNIALDSAECPQAATDNLGIKHDFIEVLTVEGNEVLHLHTKDIIATKCTINLDKLTPSDIENYNKEVKSCHSSDTMQDLDVPSLKRKQRVSYQPKKKPSVTRLAAQKIIRKSKPLPTVRESNQTLSEIKKK